MGRERRSIRRTGTDFTEDQAQETREMENEPDLLEGGDAPDAEPGDTAETRGGAVIHGDDDKMLAELEAMDEEIAAEKAKRKAKPAASKPKAEEKDEEPEEEGDEDEEKPEPKKAKAEPEPEVEKPAPKEPEVPPKALDAILRREKRAKELEERSRAEVARERQEFENERRAWQDGRQAREAEDKQRDLLASRVASSDEAALQLLTRLGVKPERFEILANRLVARSGRKDLKPEFIAQWGGDSGVGTETEELRREVAEMRQWREQQERKVQEEQQRAELQRRTEVYLDRVSDAVTAEHALLSAGLKKDKARARRALHAAADVLAKRSGQYPDPHDVASEAERQLREDAEKFGLSLPTTKPKPIAGEKQTAPGTLASTTRRAAPGDDDDLKRELDEIDEKEREKKRARR